MDKIRLLTLFLLLLFLVDGCSAMNNEKKIIKQKDIGMAEQPNNEITDEKARIITSIDRSLGTLCAGEDGCNSFCHNNRGQCESYCTINKENSLCKTIFPVEALPLCNDKKDLFNTSPIVIADLTNLVPLGSLNPTGHVFPTDHIYLIVIRSQTDPNAPEKIKVFSPGDARIIQISSSEHLSASPPFTDYDIEFYPCKEIFTRFGHLTSLSEKIIAQLGVSDKDCRTYRTGGGDYKRCTKNVDIELKAGEEIGTVGGFQGAAAGLDFWLADYRTEKIQYANPSRWGGHSLYIVCPVDYFTADVRKKLYEQFKDFKGNPKTIKPICGTIEQDVAGTAQGTWFVKGTKQTYPEDQHLALAHDNFNPLKEAFSVGTSLHSLGSGVYYFDPKNSGFVNRDFEDVLPNGNIYCYDSLTQRFDNPSPTRIILQLTSPTALRIQGQQFDSCGTGPWSFDNFTEFER